jgi:hypothetical protein
MLPCTHAPRRSPLGLGVLTGKGVTAWRRALASLAVPQPAPPASLAAVPGQAGRLPAPVAAELISVLAAVALAGTDQVRGLEEDFLLA